MENLFDAASFPLGVNDTSVEFDDGVGVGAGGGGGSVEGFTDTEAGAEDGARVEAEDGRAVANRAGKGFADERGEDW